MRLSGHSQMTQRRVIPDDYQKAFFCLPQTKDVREEHQSLMGRPRRRLTFCPQPDRMPHKKFTQARSQEEYPAPPYPPTPSVCLSVGSARITPVQFRLCDVGQLPINEVALQVLMQLYT
ncbi:hypothetical protein JOB18_048997 [Scomber scombrus]|uniref:Uncharacterized protein n=1 Tax=Scomber scombrus TaxID=13677 RepID=A0AAV1NIN0_SCOSC